MPEYTEVLPRDSEFWEKCARHTAKQTSRNLAYLYLCDPCAVRLLAQALNGRPPVYHGDTVEGYCGLCNERKTVTFRQWFACPICWNVVSSYQRAIAPPLALRTFWDEKIAPAMPSFVVKETDVVFLSPFERQAKTKRAQAESLDSSDFLISEQSDGVLHPRFNIELKAGPGSIDEMSEFQLDVNDYNDIVGVVRKTGLPGYVVHVQLGFLYDPPTRQTHAVRMWWTDIATLSGHKKAVKLRRDENKPAAYFEPEAFRPIDTFPDQVLDRKFEQLTRLLQERPPEFLS